MPLIEYFLKELSVQLGSPILLYEFEMITGEPGAAYSSSSSAGNLFWRYCNQSFDYQWAGSTWYASAIKPSRIVQSSEINRDGLTLTFPRDDAFARQFVGFVPEFVCLVTVYRGHLTQGDDAFAVYWKGRIGASKTDKQEIKMSCESVFTSLRRYGLRARYTRTCRHVLYVGGCRLNRLDFQHAGLATAADRASVTAAVFASRPDGYWIGGILEAPDGAMRYIVGHSGDTVTLWRPIQSILDDLAQALPVVVYVYPGCMKSVEDCIDKFDNLENYGGFPLLPTRNPFDGRSIV